MLSVINLSMLIWRSYKYVSTWNQLPSLQCINGQQKGTHLLSIWFGLMVFNATINNISVISWGSVLLVEETGVPRENHRPVEITDKHYHIMLYTSLWWWFELTASVVKGTDCIGSCKSNYHTITTTPTDLLSKYKIQWNALGWPSFH